MKISNGSQDLAALSLKTVSAGAARNFAAVKNLASVSLNPQPLPPKEVSVGAVGNFAAARNFDSVALNPQPLPPKEISGGAAGRDDVTKTKIDSFTDKAKSDLDSMSEMGEVESLRLQMAMDRTSKMMSTLSNLSEKISHTAEGITANLK